MLDVREVVIGGGSEAVPQARHFAASALSDVVAASTIDDVGLVVTELVTNAFLHAAPPVTVRVSRADRLVRIEVEDAGHGMPVQVSSTSRSMTGRGLSLVAAVSESWGVSPSNSGGKLVWAEVPEDGGEGQGAEPEIDADALLASWDSEPAAEPTYRIRLGSVPTGMLLAAKGHIDNLVRELTLAKAEEAASGIPLPTAMARLIATVMTDFVDARSEIKAQALAAAARDESLTDLVLNLPISAAEAGARYLAALDAADRYARAARLLTLSAPRSHQVFRRWYVQAIVEQLRAVSDGRPPAPLVPFPQTLAQEVDQLAWLEHTWARLQLLQKVTGELTEAQTVNDVAGIVVNNAFEFLGAATARVFLLTEDGMLRSLAVRGGDPALIPRYQEFSVKGDLPGSVVARTGQPIFLRNVAQIRQRFPELVKAHAVERSLHVAPLIIGQRTIGVLALSFPGSSDVEEETQVEFVGSLADALAQAVERALANDQAREANERLSFLADASIALSATLDYEATLDAVSRLLVPRLADWCVVQILRNGELHTAALRHFDSAKVEWVHGISDRYPTRWDAVGGVANALHTGRSHVYPTVRLERIERTAVNSEQLAIIDALGMSSAMIISLAGRSGVFGVVTLIYAESGRHYAAADVPFVEDVIRRAALALETAETFREQSGRLASVTRVAEAAQRAILAPPPVRLGPLVLAARYVSAAAEARVGGDLYEVVERPGAVRLLIGDVRGKGLAAVRTATIVLGEFRAAAADISELSDVAKQIDRRLRPYLSDEDFVTALIAEVSDDGRYAVVSCGHPPALLISRGKIRELVVDQSLPLGLGAAPAVTTGQLSAGERLLMYTDGIMESRRPDGQFVDLFRTVAPLTNGPIGAGLDHVLQTLQDAVGSHLSDDIALLVAEYRPRTPSSTASG